MSWGRGKSNYFTTVTSIVAHFGFGVLQVVRVGSKLRKVKIQHLPPSPMFGESSPNHVILHFSPKN